MKNFIKFFALAIACILMMSAVAFAEGEPAITITNEVIDEDAGIYAFRVAAEANPGIKVFSIHFSYNSDVVIPYDYAFETSFDVTDTATNETTSYIDDVYYKDDNAICFEVATKLTLNTTLYEIDAANNRTAVYPVFSTSSNRSAHTAGNVFDYYYTLASGKTIDDVEFALEDTSTVFTNIKGTSNKDSAVHIYASVTDGTEYKGVNGEIIVDAFFDEEEVTASKITVPAGSTVYFVDGTSTTYAAETEVEVPAAAGLLYVNTGYTTHAVYAVDANGVATKVDALDNAVLGMDNASIRTSGVKGIRFASAFNNDAKALDFDESAAYEIAEYGFIVTAETTATGLKDTAYTLDMALVAAGKAKTGVAYNKADGTDVIYSITEDDYTIFTSVLKNIPTSKASLTATIASRPYYIVTDGENETILYGEITKRSIYDVAKLIKNANGTDYTENKAYIDEIITAVDGTQPAVLTTEITLDVSKLFD